MHIMHLVFIKLVKNVNFHLNGKDAPGLENFFNIVKLTIYLIYFAFIKEDIIVNQYKQNKKIQKKNKKFFLFKAKVVTLSIR